MAATIPQPNPDRLTALPDSLLQQIISSLPLAEAVRTSTLSSDWKHLWKHLDHINFRYVFKWNDYDEDDDRNSMDATYRALSSQSASLSINKFSVSVEALDLRWLNELIQWALSRQVKTISLTFYCGFEYPMPRCFYDTSSLENLTIGGERWLSILFLDDHTPVLGWKSLKTLHLSKVHVTSAMIAKVLPGCPVLETLVLDETLMSEGTILLEQTPSVKTLRLVNVQCDYFRGLSVDVSQLEYLYYIGNPRGESLIVRNASSSLKANLNVLDPGGYSEDLKNGTFAEFGTPLLESLCRANELVLGSNFIYVSSFMEPSEKLCPVFWCKDMTICLYTGDREFFMTARLFKRSPYVETLVINVDHKWTKWELKNDTQSVWVVDEAYGFSLPKVEFKCLKCLKIFHTFTEENSDKRFNWYAVKRYFRLAVCIARNAPLLEELVVAIVPVNNSKRVSKKFLRLAREHSDYFGEWFEDVVGFKWEITVNKSLIEIMYKWDSS